MTSLDLITGPPSWPGCALGGWAAAWTSGRCSPDDVADTLADFAPRHELVGSDDDSPRVDGRLRLLALLRGSRELHVALPVAGDPQGLPPDPATETALRHGEVLVIRHGAADSAGPPTALVPQLDDDVCRWSVHRFAADFADPAPVGLGQVEFDLRQAVRDSAEIIAGLGRAQDGAVRAADLRTALQHLIVRLRVNLPPHDNDRAERLLESAAQVEAIVTLADRKGATFGATARHLDIGDTHLRTLTRQARAARAAAVNAVIAELSPTGDR